MTEPKDDPGLAGKVAIVAGGGAVGDGIGNGRAAAILLGRAGTKVLVVDRDIALAGRTAEMITAEGGTAASHAADLTDEKQARDMVTAALDRFGRLDYLDNNVGISSRGSRRGGGPRHLAPRHAGQSRARCSWPPSMPFQP